MTLNDTIADARALLVEFDALIESTRDSNDRKDFTSVIWEDEFKYPSNLLGVMMHSDYIGKHRKKNK